MQQHLGNGMSPTTSRFKLVRTLSAVITLASVGVLSLVVAESGGTVSKHTVVTRHVVHSRVKEALPATPAPSLTPGTTPVATAAPATTPTVTTPVVTAPASTTPATTPTPTAPSPTTTGTHHPGRDRRRTARLPLGSVLPEESRWAGVAHRVRTGVRSVLGGSLRVGGRFPTGA